VFDSGHIVQNEKCREITQVRCNKCLKFRGAKDQMYTGTFIIWYHNTFFYIYYKNNKLWLSRIEVNKILYLLNGL